MMKHLHPISKGLTWGAAPHCGWPYYLYWCVGDEGLVARYSNLHALVIYPEDKSILPEFEISLDFPFLACPNEGDFYVVQDSDEMFACEYSKEDHTAGPYLPGPQSVLSLSRWVALQHEGHVKLLGKTIRIHSKGCETPAWKLAENQADQVILKTMQLLPLVNTIWGSNSPFRLVNEGTARVKRGSFLFLKAIAPPPVRRLYRRLKPRA